MQFSFCWNRFRHCRDTKFRSILWNDLPCWHTRLTWGARVYPKLSCSCNRTFLLLRTLWCWAWCSTAAANSHLFSLLLNKLLPILRTKHFPKIRWDRLRAFWPFVRFHKACAVPMITIRDWSTSWSVLDIRKNWFLSRPFITGKCVKHCLRWLVNCFFTCFCMFLCLQFGLKRNRTRISNDIVSKAVRLGLFGLFQCTEWEDKTSRDELNTSCSLHCDAARFCMVIQCF